MKNLQLSIFFVIVVFKVTAQKQHNLSLVAGVNYPLYSVSPQLNAKTIPDNDDFRLSFATSINYLYRPKFGKISYSTKLGIEELSFSNKLSGIGSFDTPTIFRSRYSVLGLSAFWENNSIVRPFVGLDFDQNLSIRNNKIPGKNVAGINEMSDKIWLPKAGFQIEKKNILCLFEYRYGVNTFKKIVLDDFRGGKETTKFNVQVLSLSIGYHF